MHNQVAPEGIGVAALAASLGLWARTGGLHSLTRSQRASGARSCGNGCVVVGRWVDRKC